VDGSYADAPADEDVKLAHLEGAKDAEGVMDVRSAGGRTLVFNDAVMNMPRLGGPAGFFLAPTGRLAVPRFARWVWLKDKRAFKAHLARLAGDDVARLIPGHGAIVAEQAAEALRAVAAAV
jgi:hypothetical protein